METPITLILSLLLAFALSYSIILPLIRLAYEKKLFEANNTLKVHAEQVCSLGGVAIFSSFWMTVNILGTNDLPFRCGWLMSGSLFLFLTGVFDDLLGVSPYKRLVIQVGVAALLFFGGMQIQQVPILNIELHPVISFFATILLIGAVVNAFNFIDGINGLAGGLTVISSGFFAATFYQVGNYQLSQIALALGGASLGFLLFNFGKAKIFMGDNGSTFIGILLSVLCITFLQESLPHTPSNTVSPLLALAIILVPIADMVKVIFGRLIRRKSPFHGDRTHIHHLLHKHGLSPATSCILLYVWQVVIILFAQYCLPQNAWLAALMLAMIGGFPYFAITMWSKYRPSVADMEDEKPQPLNAPSAGELL